MNFLTSVPPAFLEEKLFLPAGDTQQFTRLDFLIRHRRVFSSEFSLHIEGGILGFGVCIY